MLLRRIADHLKAQNWTAVVLDFIIVVVGVLIGIELSNWNEDRLRKADDARYLVRIEQDLAAMKERMGRSRKRTAELRDAGITTLTALNQCRDDPEERETYRTIFLGYQISPPLRIYRAAYDEMTAVGAFARIEDEMLKNAIVNVYAELSEFHEVSGFIRRDLSNAGQILWEKVDFGFDQGDGRLWMTTRYDMAALCKDRQVRNAMWELVDTNDDWTRYATNTIEEIDAALAAIAAARKAAAK